jgi:hypothetical protein
MADHWYHPDGRPCHTVPRARGEGERATTLADARKLGLLPSVTTILAIVDKPQLTQWKITEALKLARVVPPEDDETPEAYAARIIERSYDETAGAAADEGSRIHAAIEASYQGADVPEEYTPHVEATVRAIDDAFPGITDWVPERRVVSALGYAGTCDLHSPAAGIVVDFKCKAIAPDEKKQLAFDQHRQLAAYGHALFPADTPLTCANVFVSRTHPGHVRVHPWSDAQVAAGWAQFRAAFDLWKLERGYDPQERVYGQ